MVLDTMAKFRLTAAERTEFEAAARKRGMTFSRFARLALSHAVRGITCDTVRADLVAIRRDANALEALIPTLQPAEAARVQATAAQLRRVAARHL